MSLAGAVAGAIKGAVASRRKGEMIHHASNKATSLKSKASGALKAAGPLQAAGKLKGAGAK